MEIKGVARLIHCGDVRPTRKQQLSACRVPVAWPRRCSRPVASAAATAAARIGADTCAATCAAAGEVEGAVAVLHSERCGGDAVMR